MTFHFLLFLVPLHVRCSEHQVQRWCWSTWNCRAENQPRYFLWSSMLVWQKVWWFRTKKTNFIIVIILHHHQHHHHHDHDDYLTPVQERWCWSRSLFRGRSTSRVSQTPAKWEVNPFFLKSIIHHINIVMIIWIHMNMDSGIWIVMTIRLIIFPQGCVRMVGRTPFPSPQHPNAIFCCHSCYVKFRWGLLWLSSVKTSSSRQRMGSLDNLSLLEMFGSAAPESTNSALLAFRWRQHIA